ncbi:PREDICTED: spermine oxidase-like [Amphimedon queenslandica]|uniref:Amine oxidase domain-containing protein n=1 Tax=Amphimedon queenslandica TaxID=400682 RepID=A0A1X7V0D6_AMPQE|nr:PREDICTED: spermine oxidase-like [Amphimedon queenslandica]|eukprot:XP_019851354.1 PREDICTED: spermine oxidase-like [Amphimedon queenslandica]
MASKENVVIIGGGLSGLAAASKLVREGKELFTVSLLEANDRLGGRIQSIVLPDGTIVPAGATYFHGTEGNSVYEYYTSQVRTGGMDLINEEDMEGLYVSSNGQQLPPGLVEEVETCYEKCVDKEALLSWSLSNGRNRSMREYLEDRLYPMIEGVVREASADADPYRILECFLSAEGISEGSKYVRDISIESYINWEWLEGGKSVFTDSNPFQSVVKSLEKSLPNDAVHLNCKVERISWNNKDIIVSCTNGRSFTAKHVIITVSLGVLKELVHDSFFDPPLPLDKVKAVNCLGYGLVNKIILQFESPLFEDKYFILRLCWSERDKERDVVKLNPWLAGLHQIEHYPTPSSHVYVGWVSDEDALAVEKLPSGALKNTLILVLKLFLGNSIPSLLNVVSTSWSNEYTCGSYSYTPVSCPASLREELSSPADPNLKLLFAGEATCTRQYSCAHPAYDTGLREAERLLKHYNNNCNKF